MAKTKSIPEVKNWLVVFDFEQLLTDEVLDHVFFPPEEYADRGYSSLLTQGPHWHPLHWEFQSPSPERTTKTLLWTVKTSLNLKPFDTEELVENQRRRIAEHWQKISASPVWKWLNDQQYFLEALKTFKRKKKPNTGYAHPYADFRFYLIAGGVLGGFIANGRKAEPTPTMKSKESAIKHIEKLQADLYCGVRFDDDAKNIRLKTLLREFRAAIEKSKSVRAERNDKKDKPYRDLNRRLARALKSRYGEASATIVHKLAAAAGSNLTERAVKKHLQGL